MNASKPSDQSKGLGGNIGCSDENLYMVIKGFPTVVTQDQQFKIGEKPTVVLYTYINRHVGTHARQNQEQYQTRLFLD